MLETFAYIFICFKYLPAANWSDTPLVTDTPLVRHSPCAVHAGMRSTIGRYASHWNAFLFIITFSCAVQFAITNDGCYRPQRSWAKVIFSQACVKNSVHRGGEGVCVSACWDTPPGTRPPQPPDQADPPPDQTPPGTRHTPPRSGRPPGTRPPRTSQTPPREADCSIRSTSGRYASYWNAFLFKINSETPHVH